MKKRVAYTLTRCQMVLNLYRGVFVWKISRVEADEKRKAAGTETQRTAEPSSERIQGVITGQRRT